MERQTFLNLLDKYLNDNATPEEQLLLEEYYKRLDEKSKAELTAEEEEALHYAIFQQIQQGIAEPEKVIDIRRKRTSYRWIAAASIAVFLSAGGYYLLNKPKQVLQTAQVTPKNDVAPGRNQATLTLANGQKIILTKQLSGQVATQGQTTIQAAQGELVYQANKEETTVSYNSVSTAKGEQSPFPLVLADGSKVWLNAESKLTFPTAFNGKERIVKLTGEAYFEVKHNAAQPFKVQTEKQTIEDIGTVFNVNAYVNEKTTHTTLVSGSIKVNDLILKPGEQTDGKKVKSVDVAQYIAWKNGDFDFVDTDIQTVMRQLERWYNIEVEYKGPVSQEGFNAEISRTKNISVILHGLEKTKGVHFKIDGRRVIVSQ